MRTPGTFYNLPYTTATALLDFPTQLHYFDICPAHCGPQGSKLTDLINSRHENPKYLPGISLGDNTVADPDLESTVSSSRSTGLGYRASTLGSGRLLKTVATMAD
jgi:hypothetical protein